MKHFNNNRAWSIVPRHLVSPISETYIRYTFALPRKPSCAVQFRLVGLFPHRITLKNKNVDDFYYNATKIRTHTHRSVEGLVWVVEVEVGGAAAVAAATVSRVSRGVHPC